MAVETREQATQGSTTAFLDLYRGKFNAPSSLTALRAASDPAFNSVPFKNSINNGITVDDTGTGHLLLDALNFSDITHGSGGFGKTQFGSDGVYISLGQFFSYNLNHALPKAITSDGARLLMVDSNPDGVDDAKHPPRYFLLYDKGTGKDDWRATILVPSGFQEETGTLAMDAFSISNQGGKAFLDATSYLHVGQSFEEAPYKRSGNDTLKLINDLAHKTARAYQSPTTEKLGAQGLQMAV